VEQPLRCSRIPPQERRQGLQCTIDGLAQRSGFVWPRPLQDEVRHGLLQPEGSGVANAQAQPPEIGIAQGGRNVSNAVVAAVATALFEPNLSGWQVELIVNHQELLRFDLVEVAHGLDGRTGAVHEGVWLEQPEATGDQTRDRKSVV
jgi:hypothetical protein